MLASQDVDRQKVYHTIPSRVGEPLFKPVGRLVLIDLERIPSVWRFLRGHLPVGHEMFQTEVQAGFEFVDEIARPDVLVQRPISMHQSATSVARLPSPF